MKLFDNVSGKIKIVAKILLFLGVVISIVLPILLLINAAAEYESAPISAFVIFFAGPLVSYFLALLLYGYGELISNPAKAQFSSSAKPIVSASPEINEIEKYRELKEQGILTEEEFHAKEEQLTALLRGGKQ